jgi:hypothetical protein
MLNKTVKSGSVIQKSGLYLGVVVLLFASLAATMHRAYAASTMTSASVLESNMNSSGTSTFFVDFKAGAADGPGTLTITWPAGFTVATSQTPTTTACTSIFSGAAALPGTLTAAGSGQVITISSVTSLTSASQYCVGLTGTTPITNNATPGNYTVALADGTDTTSVGVDVISNDQISVTASVAPSFTLGFGSNSDALGTLASGSLTVSSPGVNLTVSTNAANGWGLWAEDSNAGLHSTAASKTIASLSAGSNHTMNGGTLGTEAYALGVTTANATTAYADAGGITGGGLSATALNEIASAAIPGSSVGVTVKELADISGTTPAAPDYGDTITIIGDGSF